MSIVQCDCPCCRRNNSLGSLSVRPVAQPMQVPEGFVVVKESEIHKAVKRYLTKRQQGYFMAEIRTVLAAATKEKANE